MVRLATVAAPHLGRRVRCRSAPHAHDSGPAESFRFFAAQGTYTLRDRSPQRWFALASRLQPAREPKGMGLQPAESVSTPAFRSLHVSSRGSDHSRFVPYVFRVYRLARQTM